MRPLFFHIGLPKTGTTALQTYLALNEAELQSHGLLYLPIGPRRPGGSGLLDQGNGQPLARSFYPASDPYHLRQNNRALLNELEQALANCNDHAPIISGEAFCEIGTDQISGLVKKMQSHGFAPKILMWVREQGSYLESRYNQFVKKRMETRTFEAFADERCETAAYLRYDTFATELAGLVGKENVLLQLHGEADICDTVDTIFNLPTGTLKRPAKGTNESIPPRKMEILRELNRLNRPQRFAKDVMQNEALLRDSTDYEPVTIISPDYRKRLSERYEAENQKLAENWFDRDQVFPVKDKRFVSQETLFDDISKRDIIQILGGKLVRDEERFVRLERQVAQLQRLLKQASKP